jgi:hypothetical protein
MDFDELLAQADPMAGTVVKAPSSGVVETLKELTMSTPLLTPAVVAPPVTSHRGRRRRIVIIASVAALAVAVPVAALTGGIHTGFFASDGDTELVHGSELLNVSDPAIVEVVREEAAQVPLPAGASYDALLRRYPVAEPSLEQREGLRTGIEFFAQCRWYEHWLAGDAAVRASDAQTIATFVHWKFMDRFAPGDSGPQMTRDMVAQVQRGEETLVRQWVTANC